MYLYYIPLYRALHMLTPMLTYACAYVVFTDRNHSRYAISGWYPDEWRRLLCVYRGEPRGWNKIRSKYTFWTNVEVV